MIKMMVSENVISEDPIYYEDLVDFVKFSLNDRIKLNHDFHSFSQMFFYY